MRAILVVVAVLALVGCGAPEQGDPPAATSPSEPASMTAETTPAETTTETPPRPTGTVIKTADSEFGPMLFDGSKQAIYLFDKEKSSKPECYDACAQAWPPVLTKGQPRSAGDVRDDLLGTVKRTDGTTQVTYNDHPLYFYAHEEPGEVECHNVNLNGGLWFVVTPKGDAAPA